MTKTHRATVLAVLEALKSHDCITGYTIDDDDGRPNWKDHGFNKAFEELKTNPTPLGLKKKNERAWLMVLLAQKNKKTVDEWTFKSFKQKYDL
jgi:hypothetical protein